jgi:hypothetical protein
MIIKRGDDFLEENADYITYGITIGNHTNKIQVYGNEKLRDLIITLLRQRETKRKIRTLNNN